MTLKSPTLALDCSVKNITLALISEGEIIASHNAIPEDSQSQTILKSIDGVLQQGQTGLSAIGDVIFCHGPGSFTSLRVGLATLQGLFWGRDMRVMAASSLLFRCHSCLGLKDADEQVILSCITLGRDRFAVGTWDGTHAAPDYRENVFTLDAWRRHVAGWDCRVLVCGLGLDNNTLAAELEKTRVIPEDIVRPEAFLHLIKNKSNDSTLLKQTLLHYMIAPDLGKS